MSRLRKKFPDDGCRVDLRKLWKATVVLKHYDAHDNLIGQETATNSITYAAADVLMNALLRSGPSQITHLYARFGDSGANPGFLAPPGGDLAAASRSTFVQSSNSATGGLWVPILAAPVQSSGDSLYASNKATFFFRIPYNISNDQVDPDNFNCATSYIYALGLGVARNSIDRSQDVIMSTLQAYGWNGLDLAQGYFTKFQIASGGQIAVDYHIELALP